MLEPIADLRASLERLRGLLKVQERAVVELEARSRPRQAAADAALKLKTMLRT